MILILALLHLSFSTSLGNYCSTAGWSDTERDEFEESYNSVHTKVFKEVFDAQMDFRPQSNQVPQAEYDCNLESSAQTSANSCPIGYHGRQPPHVADHIFKVWSNSPITFMSLGDEATKSWLMDLQQLKKEDYVNFNSTDSRPDANFEISWWLGTKIGCAYNRCPSSVQGPRYENIVVCHVVI